MTLALSTYGEDPLPGENPSNGQFKPEAVEPASLESLFDAFWRRTQQEWHTLKPDMDEPEAWMERLYAWREREKAADQERAAAYPPELEVEFYDASDPLIRRARRIQAGEQPGDSIGVAIENAQPDSSRYAAALEAGYHALTDATDLFWGVIDEDEMRKRLE